MQKKEENTTGIGIGLFLCGVACLLFPKVAPPMPLWVVWIFSGVGFFLMLLGTLGTCIEFFGKK